MKNEIKKRLIYIMTLVITFVTITNSYYCVPVKADVISDAYDAVTAIGRLIGTNSDVEENILREAFWQTVIPTGYIISPVIKAEGELLRKAWAKALNRKYGNSNKTASNLTQSDMNEIAQDLYQNISVTNNNITYNDNSKALLMDYIDEVNNRTPYVYRYTRDIQKTTTSWSNGIVYNQVRQIIESKQDNYYVIYARGSGNNPKFFFYFVPKVANTQFVNYTGAWDAKRVGVANYQSWEWILKQNVSAISCNNYQLSENRLVLVDHNRVDMYALSTLAENQPDLTGWTNDGATQGNPFYILNSGRREQIILWNSLNDMKQGSIGQQPYFISDSFNNFRNMSTSYTIDNSNVNKITYGDITTYINKYYDENHDYPTQPVIDIYINNNVPDADPTPTPNPDPNNPNNPSTGGGSNTVSGNGSYAATANATANATNGNVNVTVNNNPSITLGWPTLSGNGVSDNTVSGNTITGGVDNIFGFISYLGQVLGNLIKNVGNALVDLVQGIAEIIASIFEAIPNVFNDFMTGVFGWLPAELRALIVLAISAMLIVGIIKLIRG